MANLISRSRNYINHFSLITRVGLLSLLNQRLSSNTLSFTTTAAVGFVKPPPASFSGKSVPIFRCARYQSNKAGEAQLETIYYEEDRHDYQINHENQVMDFPGGKVPITPQMKFISESSEKRLPCYVVLDDDGHLIPGTIFEEVSKELAVKMYSSMVTLQTMDTIFYEAQRQGRLSFYLTTAGEEAINIASAAALTLDDVVLPQYREVGVILWRGYSVQQIAHQLFGNKFDYGKGRQMPIHHGSNELNYFTISSPIATQIPQAVGVAYSLKMDKTEACAVTYFGDGSTSEGDFHAALNFAAVLDAPVIFICRNNGWAISTPVNEQFRSDGIASKGPAYGIRSIRVDGNDALATYSAIRAAREMAIKEQRPILVEVMTYRVSHHSTSDDSTKYRPVEEIEHWKTAKSPISRFRKYIQRNGWWSDENESELRRDIRKQKLKEAERERINNLEEFERKANVQLERQLVLASEWSRKLLAMQGKLKGTEWDPENSHRIDYSEFQNLLNANNVQFMEYSNYGQTVSVILPYYKDGKTKRSGVDTKKEIVFKRHLIDRMPIDSWNDVWQKLHQQLVNVDVYNVNNIPAEVYSTVATAVVWSMRLAVSVLLYIWIDNKMRPIYSKLIPCDLGSPPKKEREPLKQRALGSLGKSRAKFISAEEKTGITFDDFAGQEYIKRELQEIVRILRNEEEFQDKGIYCPKGVLLHGPPGTGKTLLAKAIAGEAGLPFFAANGTDFVEMFVGVAASRVKDLFSSARSFAPSIIFIDEIDAIGSKRGGPDIGGGGAEREQGLLQILTEMDGFKVSTSQVLVIGATNRLDILDPALLRKGRFDKIIRVGLPSKDGRLAILKVHARNKFFRSEAEKDSLLQEIAEQTEDFTGAELQNILNEAGILTARKDLDYIGRDELLEALKRQKGTFETGQEDSTEVPEELTLRLAYREAAVAVLACNLPDPYRPFSETDIKSIRSQPNMQFLEIGGRVFKRKADYVNSIVRACAPRVIEEEMFGIDNLCWISAKATLEASRLAEFLILQTGLTALGKAYYRYQRDLLPNLPAKIEALRDEYMRYAVEKCLSILKENQAAVETITDVLLEKGEIKADEIWSIYKSSPKSPQPAVSPIDEYGSLIYAGRWGVHGVSLPGRVTFAPGNVGFATFGAPRPMETQIISDETWKLIDGIWDKRVEEMKAADSLEIEDEEEKPKLLMASHFL